MNELLSFCCRLSGLILLLCFHFSCPYFRNEVGGESERSVALSRGGCNQLSKSPETEQGSNLDQSSTHTPSSARGFCLLDTPETFWKNGYCPYDGNVGVAGKNVIERIDCGSAFYKNFFYGQGKQRSKDISRELYIKLLLVVTDFRLINFSLSSLLNFLPISIFGEEVHDPQSSIF